MINGSVRFAYRTRVLSQKAKLPFSTWLSLANGKSKPGRRKRSRLGVLVHPDADKVPAAERPDWQAAALDELLHLLASALQDHELIAATTLYDIECLIQKLLRQLGAVLTRTLAQQGAAQAPRPRCPRCGQLMQVRNRRRRQLLGITGAFSLQHTEYRCPTCGEVVVPAGERWQLAREQWTPALQQALARSGAEVASFARATELVGGILQMYGLTADSTVRTTEALGAVAEAQAQQAIAAAAQQPQPAAPRRASRGPLPCCSDSTRPRYTPAGAGGMPRSAWWHLLAASGRPGASTAISA